MGTGNDYHSVYESTHMCQQHAKIKELEKENKELKKKLAVLEHAQKWIRHK